MRRAIRQAKPVVVQVDDETYVVRFGRPGHPRIYRRIGTTERRLADDDPAIEKVGRAMVADRERRKAAGAAEAERRKSWRYRVLRWAGVRWARFVAWLEKSMSVLARDPGMME